MPRTSIPELVLRKVEKGSSRLAILVQKVRRALEPQTIARAEKELAQSYLLEIYGEDRMVALGISPEESDAIICITTGADYNVTGGATTYEAEAKPFRTAAASNAAFFAEEEAKKLAEEEKKS